MSFITREQYDAAIGGYTFLEKIAAEFAKEYVDEFGIGYIDTVDIDYEEPPGYIAIETWQSYCGCCSPDTFYYAVPMDYLWDDNWKVREQEKLDKKKLKEEKERAKDKAKEEKKREKARYKSYLSMKEEYEK